VIEDWGLGPVFAYESLLTWRRWKPRLVCSLLTLVLPAALALVWWEQGWPRVGEIFFYTLVALQLTLVLVAVPAHTAASFCWDKARGPLLQVLATDLSAAEIVLGKWAAHSLPVLGLVLASLPFLFAGALLGLIDPGAVGGAFLVTIGVAVVGSSLALALSIWRTKTHDVLLAVYLTWAALILASPMWNLLARRWGFLPAPPWLVKVNPIALAFAPYANPKGWSLTDDLDFLGGTMTVAALLLLAAMSYLRRAILSQASQPPPRRYISTHTAKRWLIGPSLDGNPVLWREWHRRRPSRWVLLLWTVYAALATLFSLLAIEDDGHDVAGLVNAFQVTIGLLLVSPASATAIAEERGRGSLDLLLASPLSTRSIVLGKWWGAFRAVPLLAVLPGLVTACHAVPNKQGFAVLLVIGLVLAYGAAIISAGLALAIWVRRPHRAVGLSVGAYMLITVGGFVVGILSFRWFPRATGMAVASPWFGVGNLTGVAAQQTISPQRGDVYTWCVFWIVIYTATAMVLLLTTLATFDRSLGRAR